MVTPRIFALGLGAVMLLIGLGFLALPASIDYNSTSVSCGSGFSGLSNEPGLADAGSDIGRVIAGVPADEGSPREEACAAKIQTRQVVGWPMLGVGFVVLLGAALIGKDLRGIGQTFMLPPVADTPRAGVPASDDTPTKPTDH